MFYFALIFSIKLLLPFLICGKIKNELILIVTHSNLTFVAMAPDEYIRCQATNKLFIGRRMLLVN